MGIWAASLVVTPQAHYQLLQAMMYSSLPYILQVFAHLAIHTHSHVSAYRIATRPFLTFDAFSDTSQIDGIGEEYRSTTYTIPVTKYVCCPS